MKQKGNIGVTTENIFPVIKKFLYSENEIFIREIVSNAVDATQKLRTLASKGELKGETGDLTVRVTVDKKKGTLTVSDRGIGMTAEEIDRYINQIAFSGANDFLDKYKDDAQAIIGHFGLGFYSSFMVSKKVEIVTKSWQEGAQAVKWSCDGSPEYKIEDAKREDRGTDIVMYIDDDCKDFLEEAKVEQLLKKFCHFLPVPVAFGKKKDWKDGKQVETEEDNVINDTTPLWTKKPSDLKDEDYKAFYRELYPMSDEPLFWIHLNVDYPFHLTGVLYFPKVRSNFDLQKNKIQLYCNQVFVTEEVEGIVPDFLTLLHGVIDSPDIPLNVSRSYLQSDQNVKKISTYISKKVSDRLSSLFKTDRADFEAKWDDIKIFIHYGMLSETDFYDKASKFALLKDTDGKFYTYDEYNTLIKDQQTDKDGNLIYLYANNKEAEFSYIEAAQRKGYNVLLMDGELDPAMVGMFEQKFEKCRFNRVDADVVDRLIVKDDAQTGEALDAGKQELLQGVFQTQMPKLAGTEFHVETQAMGETAAPIVITQSEYMRRMKDMAKLQPGMAFYGEMPNMMNIVLNTDHQLIKTVLADSEKAVGEALKPIDAEIAGLTARRDAINQQNKDLKWDEIPQERKDDLSATEKEMEEQKQKKTAVMGEYAADNKVVHQLIDLALLQNGLLRGEALNNFVRRSIELI
ncbi:MAG: molecular chaperone HtpG [Prevotellaceae bacterium]|nr:molecular chaperone HtpG [Prevotellaceae bacterium]